MRSLLVRFEPYALSLALKVRLRRVLAAGLAEQQVQPRGIAVRTSLRQLERLGAAVVRDVVQRAFARTRSPWGNSLPELEAEYGAGRYGWLPEVWLTYQTDLGEVGLADGNPRVSSAGRPSSGAFLRSVASDRVHALDSGTTILIGRSSFCDLQIDDPQVSRQHGRLWREATGWFVAPESGTTNPLLINDEAIDGPTRLAFGDRVAFGPAARYVFSPAGQSDAEKQAETLAATSPRAEREDTALAQTQFLAFEEQPTDGSRAGHEPSARQELPESPAGGQVTNPGDLAEHPGEDNATARPMPGHDGAEPEDSPNAKLQGVDSSPKPPRLRLLDAVAAIERATPRGWPGRPRDWVLSFCEDADVERSSVHQLWEARNRAAHAELGEVDPHRIIEAAASAERILEHLDDQGHQIQVYDTSLATPASPDP